MIRSDAAGWPEFARTLREPSQTPIFAVDYSIAGQISYYGRQPVYTAAGQFRLWGIPDFTDLTVLSQAFLPANTITERLRMDFQTVDDPAVWDYTGDGIAKRVYIWEAQDRVAPVGQVLENLDYLRLVRGTAVQLH